MIAGYLPKRATTDVVTDQDRIQWVLGSLGVTVQKIAETVGCEDYASIGFKPTEGADAQVQELQATVNEIDLHAKEAVGKMMGVSALAAIAVECAGTGRTGSNLWGTFQALHHLARDTSNLIEQLG